MQAAHGAARIRGTALAGRYRRIAGQRGAKRAIMAVAHRLLIIVYQVIARREPYRERGADHLLRRLRQLGLAVQVLPATRPLEAIRFR